MKNFYFLLMLFVWSNVNSQNLSDNLSWLTGVQDRGASAFITKTDHFGNTIVLGIYDGCPTCFMKMEGSLIIEMGNGNDYLFLMKIDEDGVAGQPKLIPTNGQIRIADFDVNLNNDLVIYIWSNNNFSIDATEIEEGYSILNLSSSFEPNWIKNIEGASFASNSISGYSSLYSSSDQLAINKSNDIVFLGAIPSVSSDVIIDTILNEPDTFFIYETYIDTLVLDGEEFTAEGSNFFLTTLDHNGNHKWTKVYEHDNTLRIGGLALSEADKIGVCGYFGESDFTMENFTLGGIDTSGISLAYCGFASTFDEDGNLLFANRYYQNARPKFLTFDKDEQLLISAEFARETFLNADTITSISPASDQLLIKLDQDGNVDWRKRKGNSSTNQLLRIKYTSSDDIIASGELSWPKFLFSLSETGTTQESLGPNVTTNVTGLDIDFTSNGALISTGTHNGEFLLGPYTLPHEPGNSRAQFIAGFSNITDPLSITTFLGDINARIDSSICSQGTGSIQISSSIGIDWNTISWSNGASVANLENLESGSYTVTVTDIYNNTGSATFIVPEKISLEVPYNGIDDDCNTATLDDDLDQDGFVLAEDCDDLNPNINSDQVEVPYNGIDDDCNTATLDDDLDQDGFILADDCDDTNPNINPDATEIPNNGVDEDCDDEDLTTSTFDFELTDLKIYPNPVSSQLNLDVPDQMNVNVEILDLSGRPVYSQLSGKPISVLNIENGMYLIKMINLDANQILMEKIIVAK